MDCIAILKHQLERLEHLFTAFEQGDVTVVPHIYRALESHLELDCITDRLQMATLDGHGTEAIAS